MLRRYKLELPTDDQGQSLPITTEDMKRSRSKKEEEKLLGVDGFQRY